MCNARCRTFGLRNWKCSVAFGHFGSESNSHRSKGEFNLPVQQLETSRIVENTRMRCVSDS